VQLIGYTAANSEHSHFVHMYYNSETHKCDMLDIIMNMYGPSHTHIYTPILYTHTHMHTHMHAQQTA